MDGSMHVQIHVRDPVPCLPILLCLRALANMTPESARRVSVAFPTVLDYIEGAHEKDRAEEQGLVVLASVVPVCVADPTREDLLQRAVRVVRDGLPLDRCGPMALGRRQEAAFVSSSSRSCYALSLSLAPCHGRCFVAGSAISGAWRSHVHAHRSHRVPGQVGPDHGRPPPRANQLQNQWPTWRLGPGGAAAGADDPKGGSRCCPLIMSGEPSTFAPSPRPSGREQNNGGPLASPCSACSACSV